MAEQLTLDLPATEASQRRAVVVDALLWHWPHLECNRPYAEEVADVVLAALDQHEGGGRG